MAMAPIDNVCWLSVIGTQFVPPLMVFHTPPPAAAIYMMLALVGSTAMPVIRPLTFPAAPFEFSGCGPINVHVVGVSGILGADVPLTFSALADGVTASQGVTCGCKFGRGWAMTKSAEPISDTSEINKDADLNMVVSFFWPHL